MKRALAAVGIVPVMAAIVSAAPQSAKADDVVVRATASLKSSTCRNRRRCRA
jgi:hypothetical protein